MRKILLTLAAFGVLSAAAIPQVRHTPMTDVAGWEEGVTRA